MKITGNVTTSKTVTLTLSLTGDEIELFNNGCLALMEPDIPVPAVYLHAVISDPKSKTLFAAIQEGLKRALK